MSERQAARHASTRESARVRTSPIQSGALGRGELMMSEAFPMAALSTLQEGRQAYLAVASNGGPHVTPELYAWSGGQLWFAVASSTLKAKVVARHRTAGAVVSVSDRSVLVQGKVEVFDPTLMTTWAAQWRRFPAVVRAMGRFSIRNAPDLLAFGADAAAGRLGWRVPPMRVVLRLEPSRGALVEGDSIVAGWGDWSHVRPQEAAPLPVGGRRAVVGLPGPVAVPCRWFEDDQRLHVLPRLIDLLHLERSFPLGVVIDEYSAPGPAAKTGTLLRGTGHINERSGFVDVEADRFVEWNGVQTMSAEAG